MSEFGQNLKSIVIKGIEAIGNTAGSIASNTKQKVEEYNLSNNLKDLYATIGEKIYKLSKEGVAFPEDIAEIIKNVADTEHELNMLREQKESVSPESGSSADEPDDTNCCDKEITASEYAAGDNKDIPVIRIDDEDDEKTPELPESVPLSSAIDELFEKIQPVDEMVNKVNTSLDNLGDSLRKFTGEFDRQLNDFADRMMGKNDNNP